jgi:hypothetical protein
MLDYIEWIECDLYFDVDPLDMVEEPSLKEKEIEKFGISHDKALTTYPIDVYQKVMNGYCAWMDQQPEWQNYLDACKKILDETFHAKGLSEPGTLVQFEDNSIVLIGSNNCEDQYLNKKVKRYAKIIDMEILNDNI